MAWYNDHPGPIYLVLSDARRALHIDENPLLRKREKKWKGLPGSRRNRQSKGQHGRHK